MTAAEDYLRSVSFELGDLPWSQRQDLLAEIRGHLDELPAGTDLEARLGTPEHYAADLRSAAGLERRDGAGAFLRARRPRTLVLTALALIVIGLAIGGVAWVQSYQPIDFAGGSVSPAGAKVAPAGGSESVSFRAGQPFRLGTSVLNNGPFTVRVVGAHLPPGLPVRARLLMSPSLPNTGGFHGPFTRFQPFSLQPGRVRVLLLKGVYACSSTMPAHGAAIVDDFPVRFSYLWRTATVEIPIDPELSIVLPKGCPAKP